MRDMRFTQAFTFTLSALPPSVNRIWRVGRNGAPHRSSDYQAWAKAAAWELTAQRIGMVEGPFAVDLRFARKSKKHPDLDNLCKATMDALQAHGAIKDDKLAQKITLSWARQDTAVWGQVIATKEVR